MTDALVRSVRRQSAMYDPARMLEDVLESIPESWLQTMQLARPSTGVNICNMHGRPGSIWAFQAQGGPNVSMSILLEGRMEAAVEDGQAFCLESGQALLMVTGQQVCGWDVLSASRDFHLLNINLTPHALQGLTGLQMQDVLSCMRDARCDMAHVNACMAAIPLFSSLSRTVGEIERFGNLDNKVCNAFLCAKVAEGLASFLHRCTAGQGTAGHKRTMPRDRRQLRQAYAMLEHRYGEPWSVQSLAQAVSLNEKRLQAGFQSLYGCTVHECLTRIRLDVAQAMLTSGRSVTETALACGFSSVSHFSKVFRTHIGIAPGRWSQGYSGAD